MADPKQPIDLLEQALAFDPETADPNSSEFDLPPEIEAQWPEISERIWQRVKAAIEKEKQDSPDPVPHLLM
jgi:hypothetical protein